MNKRLKLKCLRISKNLNQDKMAKECKVARSTYSDIERGLIDGSLEFWLNLKNAFNLSPDEVWAMQYEGRE